MPRTTDSENRFQFDNVAEPSFGAQVGPMKLKVHPPGKCHGQFCCVHNPSQHNMREWPLNFRSDLGISERMCKHEIGHPDPDDVTWMTAQGKGWVATHGCDGCCAS